ncbi:putative bifunctional diguanylate cyclase/phosphodiesterase [Agrobacterium rubi]|uniref:EAL domain-containing protein n=2 Tax=Agrobacterium rubi TaxID=28099 RepID=A0AAE7R962_9HYPH|nr:GGDEF and EAL domain-containing protein [Agrobacterium rubi]MBP1878725.1 diguanylate cyclase (GGDEF)-like protein [Agrobacterium rubi]MCL6652914.1 diguanylate cyclase [Agrobacterium rubi]NTE88652.1 EAL domain-containing protein [Agrobacterium rubi]NTF04480.1 EAL domain-containing protein [Agrobacterium rubi]NTF10013.1 EAL domain-containing protein [Agrobacterium rubi]
MKHTLVDVVGLDPQPDASQERSADASRALFFKEADAKRRTSIRQGLWIAVPIYLLFSVTDILLIPDVSPHTMFARFVVGIAALLMLEMQIRANAKTSHMDIACATALVCGYIAWLMPAMMTTHVTNMSYYMVFGAIFMMGANLFFTFNFVLSLIASSLVLCIYFLALSYFHEDIYYQINFGTFYFSCFVFTSYVNLRLNRERYRVFLNAIEAKVQQREAEQRGEALLHLSNTDPLTGLENRRAIDSRLRQLWDGWINHQHNFAVFLIDVDFFKKYNDFYGHQEGDRCLIQVAQKLQTSLSRFDAVIGRYGGEEFIALARFTTAKDIEDIAETLRTTVQDMRLVHEKRRDGTSVITVSVGASFTRPQQDPKLERIINEADRALYLAKANGRNAVKLFDPNDPQNSDDTENVAALLNIAIAQNLVSLVYQPIKDLKSNTIVGAESLMRLRLLDGTAVPPSIFIPIAERTGAIMELGLWAIRTVCQQALKCERMPVVSVNVSPIQLKSPGFATSVAAILGEIGVSGGRLAFEITEGLEMDMNSDVLRCISDLKTLGIKIWLDDFGTGFAGLSWLRLIDFDTVKIDKSFLHDAQTPRGKLMLSDIIALIRNRGNKILVEGVETAEQLELLKELRINQVQGYYVGRPAPANLFTKDMVYRPRSVTQPA